MPPATTKYLRLTVWRREWCMVLRIWVALQDFLPGFQISLILRKAHWKHANLTYFLATILHLQLIRLPRVEHTHPSSPARPLRCQCYKILQRTQCRHTEHRFGNRPKTIIRTVSTISSRLHHADQRHSYLHGVTQ